MDAVRDLVTHKLDERGISMKDASLRQVRTPSKGAA